MRINTNISAMNTYSRLGQANAAKSGSLAKLSSGLRINKAGDDAAGLSISEKMKNQISGLTQATRNAQDGISLIQTAEGALNETHAILNRMRDLSVQAANGTNSADDLSAIQDEMTSLTSEINNIAETTKFNGITLLKGTDATTDPAKITLQIGANKDEELELELKSMTANTLLGDKYDATKGVVLYTTTDDEIDANNALDITTQLDVAIKNVSANRSKLGANQNRLDHTINNLTTTKENLAEANSRIRDVDMAEEMMAFTKSNILSQAATSMLAQANQMPQGVLQLLQ